MGLFMSQSNERTNALCSTQWKYTNTHSRLEIVLFIFCWLLFLIKCKCFPVDVFATTLFVYLILSSLDAIYRATRFSVRRLTIHLFILVVSSRTRKSKQKKYTHWLVGWPVGRSVGDCYSMQVNAYVNDFNCIAIYGWLCLRYFHLKCSFVGLLARARAHTQALCCDKHLWCGFKQLEIRLFLKWSVRKWVSFLIHAGISFFSILLLFLFFSMNFGLTHSFTCSFIHSLIVRY